MMSGSFLRRIKSMRRTFQARDERSEMPSKREWGVSCVAALLGPLCSELGGILCPPISMSMMFKI